MKILGLLLAFSWTLHIAKGFNSIGSKDRHWLNSTIYHLKKNHDFRQVTIFTHDTLLLHDKQNYVTEEFSNNFPIVKVNLLELSKKVAKRALRRLPLIRKSTSGVLNVFIMDGDINLKVSVEQLANLLRLGLSYNKKTPLPKSLVFVISRKVHENFVHNQLEIFFKQQWKNVRLLDVSVIQVAEELDQPPIMVYYNPFRKEMTTQELHALMDPAIFPDKLFDLMGYPFIVTADENVLSAVLMAEKFSNKKLQFGSWEFYKYHFGKFLNFTAILEKNEAAKKYDVEHGLIAGRSVSPYSFVGACILESTKASAAYPRIYKESIYETTPVFQFGSYLAAVMLAFLLPAWILKYSQETWNTLNVYLCLLGYPAVYIATPGRRAGTIFLVMVGVSIGIGADIVSIITDSSITRTELSLDSVEDLDKFNYKIYTMEEITDEFVLKHVKNKIIWDTSSVDCLFLLARKNDRICLCLEGYIDDVNAVLIKQLKKSEIIFNTQPLFIELTEKSPYSEKLNNFVLKNIDAHIICDSSNNQDDIQNLYKYLGKVIIRINENPIEIKHSEDDAYILNLAITLAAGLTFATLALIGEILCSYLDSRRRNRRVVRVHV